MKSAAPTKPKHSVHIRLDLDTFEVLRSYAASRGVSIASIIHDVLGRAANVIKHGHSDTPSGSPTEEKS